MKQGQKKAPPPATKPVAAETEQPQRMPPRHSPPNGIVRSPHTDAVAAAAACCPAFVPRQAVPGALIVTRPSPRGPNVVHPPRPPIEVLTPLLERLTRSPGRMRNASKI
jgi:hypothetical protein